MAEPRNLRASPRKIPEQGRDRGRRIEESKYCKRCSCCWLLCCEVVIMMSSSCMMSSSRCALLWKSSGRSIKYSSSTIMGMKRAPSRQRQCSSSINTNTKIVTASKILSCICPAITQRLARARRLNQSSPPRRHVLHRLHSGNTEAPRHDTQPDKAQYQAPSLCFLLPSALAQGKSVIEKARGL